MNALVAAGGEVPEYFREQLESAFVCFELLGLRVEASTNGARYGVSSKI
jgi:hypothetical protein